MEDNINIDRKVKALEDRVQRRALLKTEVNLRFPYKVGNYLNSRLTLSFTRRILLGEVTQSHIDI